MLQRILSFFRDHAPTDLRSRWSANGAVVVRINAKCAIPSRADADIFGHALHDALQQAIEQTTRRFELLPSHKPLYE